MSPESLAALPESAQRVARLLLELGHDKPVVVLPQTGKTSAEAAAGLGCEVAQIAKSIIFRRAADNAPVLVIASGTNRVDEAKVSAQVGALAKADAKFVRDMTGYAIGGVCPIGHAVKPVMLLDQDLFQYDSLWAAAGHPHAVFNLTPQQLADMTARRSRTWRSAPDPLAAVRPGCQRGCASSRRSAPGAGPGYNFPRVPARHRRRPVPAA